MWIFEHLDVMRSILVMLDEVELPLGLCWARATHPKDALKGYTTLDMDFLRD